MMKNCPSCRKKTAEFQLSFMPRSLCARCFCRTVEKRIRREIRTNCPLKKGDRLFICDDGSKEAKMLEYILKSLQKDFPFEFSKKGRKVMPYSLDDTVVEFMKQVLYKAKPKQQEFAPLRVVHPKEVELFCKLKKLGGKKKKFNKQDQLILDQIEAQEQKHPQVKFSILKFSSHLGNV